nr:vitamin B12-binding protein [Ligilactobacillus ruminis]
MLCQETGMRKQRDYGHISKIGDLPVIEDWVLRAYFKNRGFARNREPGVTGIFQKSRICP